MNELRVALQPKQRLFREAMDLYPVTFYGGAKGGGKSHGMRNIFLVRRFEQPGSHGAIFRRTYSELEGNHIRPLFEQYPGLRTYWNDSKKLLTLPTHPTPSTLQFCYCANESDVNMYQGWEFHDLGIEEAGQWTETMITRLRGSNRSSKPGIKPRTALTGNPGGVGHGYLKRLFVEKRYKPEEDPADYHFIQALVTDNPALMENDPGYLKRLDAEPNEALRRAYRFGDWDIFAGQFFQEISRNVHLIKPFPIPNHWNRFGSYDYGFNHPAVFGWFANDEDGNTFLYREFARAQMRVDQFAAVLNSVKDTAKLYPIVAGHDCWTMRAVLRDEPAPPTVAEQFESHGISLRRATIDRIQGAAQVRDYLAWQGRPNQRPRLYIFDTCPVTFDALTRMIHDPDRPEDVLKVDATEGDPLTGDDAYDMLRMALMSRPTITDPVARQVVRGSAEWHKKMNENLFEQALEHFKKQEDGEGGGWPSMP